MLATFAYDDLGRRTSLTRGNGTVTGYAYDDVSRLEQLTQDLSGSSTAPDLTSTFAYNPASQIVSALRTNDLYAWTGHGSGTTSATSNGLNQIGGWVSGLTYDPKGNILTDGTYAYTYSSENLLTSLTNSASGAIQGSSTFAYDPLMRLAVIDSTNSSLDAQLGYDGQEIVIEGLSSNRTRRYVHGPGVDEPLVAYLVTSTGTSRTWLHADERGSTIRASDDKGAAGGGIGRYDEYGVGTGVTRFQYTGQYWLADKGLHYYRARIYDPRLGRFLQPDPIGYGGGMNMYAYVGGDPVNYSDPFGLKKRCAKGAVSDIVVCGERESDGDDPVVSGGAALLGAGHGRGPIDSGAQLLDGGQRDADVACLSEDCWDVEITRSPGKTPFYFNGSAFVRDSRYVQPWYGPYLEYGFVAGPPLIAAGAVVVPEALVATRVAAMNPASRLFARGTGRLNSNNLLRVGQGWKGSATGGRSVFRVVFGHRTWPTIPGLPSFPWHIP